MFNKATYKRAAEISKIDPARAYDMIEKVGNTNLFEDELKGNMYSIFRLLKRKNKDFELQDIHFDGDLVSMTLVGDNRKLEVWLSVTKDIELEFMTFYAEAVDGKMPEPLCILDKVIPPKEGRPERLAAAIEIALQKAIKKLR